MAKRTTLSELRGHLHDLCETQGFPQDKLTIQPADSRIGGCQCYLNYAMGRFSFIYGDSYSGMLEWLLNGLAVNQIAAELHRYLGMGVYVNKFCITLPLDSMVYFEGNLVKIVGVGAQVTTKWVSSWEPVQQQVILYDLETTEGTILKDIPEEQLGGIHDDPDQR